MKYSSLTCRITPGVNPGDPDPWAVYELAIKRQAAGDDVTILSIGQEADEVTPAVIVDAAIASLKNGDHHYTQVTGSNELRSAVVN